jgi:hypothetical protein
MPYIIQPRRAPLLDGDDIKNAGELNFMFTHTVIDALITRNGLSYGLVNDVVGAIERLKFDMQFGEITAQPSALYDWLAEYVHQYAEDHEEDDQSQVQADVVGALECAKLELYRRLAAPYEDQKIKLNGDAYSKESVASAMNIFL